MLYLLRVFLVALLFYLIIVVVRGLVRPKTNPAFEGDESELVSDSLTGVYFEKKKAVSVTTGGKTHYFLTTENRDAWLRRNAE
ncbi:MAG: hypothetical protein LBF41_00745 [Deltaproteobacteria bacterium]|jgi:hypothetical protein|nr:hypothetical protein [Deltaproteobacteria bacterium]